MRVEFVTSAVDLAGRPQPVLPEFAFVGRSNCGKSSLINHFLGRNRLAKISSQPGKTRLLNYFRVNDLYYVVDLPGYGYAKVSKEERGRWSRLIRAYLAAGDRPLAVFHLLDVRRRPSAEDQQMALWLRQAEIPVAIAVTKIDKESKNRLKQRFQEIIRELGLAPDTPFFPTSAVQGTGRQEMQAWVEALLGPA